MDRLPDDPSLAEEISPLRVLKARLLLLAMPLLVGLVIVLILLRFDMLDPMIRPFALAFGTPTTALVSSKRVSTGTKASGNYLELNYQYSPDYAPRPELKVNGEAYAAIQTNTRVAIHFIPGCSSCIALDEDFGSARQQAMLASAGALFVAGAVFLQSYFRR